MNKNVPRCHPRHRAPLPGRARWLTATITERRQQRRPRHHDDRARAVSAAPREERKAVTKIVAEAANRKVPLRLRAWAREAIMLRRRAMPGAQAIVDASFLFYPPDSPVPAFRVWLELRLPVVVYNNPLYTATTWFRLIAAGGDR